MINVVLGALALATSLVPGFSMAGQSGARRGAPAEAPRKTSSAPRCQTTGSDPITIACEYTPAKPAAEPPANGASAVARSQPPQEAPTRILPVALNRSRLSFKTDDAGDMKIDLTFTNVGATAIADAHTVYLAVDDNTGSNYVRRVLPTVDFRGLVPGRPATFSDTLRIAAFPPGRYTISLWIPDADPDRKFNHAYNYLLSSVGVPARATGLNVLAHFTADK
jgi:hypothetical protein